MYSIGTLLLDRRRSPETEHCCRVQVVVRPHLEFASRGEESVKWNISRLVETGDSSRET
jgi:hypothetical protein